MTRRELEAALRADPHDEQTWTVLGDLLAAAGDRRGELIALEQRAAACEPSVRRSELEHRATQLFERERRTWLGPLADAGLDITWSRGFATQVVIARRHRATLETLLELPIAGLLRKLVLVRAPKLETLVTALADHPLETLELRRPKHTDAGELAALTRLRGLRALSIDGGSSAGLAAIAELPDLHELTLRRCHGALDGLALGFEALTSLELSARAEAAALGPDALAPLATLASLRRLSLRDGGWSELAPLASLTALEHLDLRSTDVIELAPLSSLSSLSHLDLTGCTELTNLEPLAGLTALVHLALAYTRVRRLQPLARLESLAHIDLSGTPVRDLSPLFELPALRKLRLEVCEVDDLQPLRTRGVKLIGVREPPPSWRDLAETLRRTSE